MMLVGHSTVGYCERLTESTGYLFTDARNLFGPEPISCVQEVEYSPSLA